MQICTKVKLKTSAEEQAAILQTMRTCNAACGTISQIAFERSTFRKYDLQSLVYYSVKKATSLVANHVIRAIAKVTDAYKLDTRTLRTFNPLGAIELDKDLLNWTIEEQVANISTLKGRLKLHFDCSADQKKLLRGKLGQADLLFREGNFYLSVAVTIEEAKPYEPEGVKGISFCQRCKPLHLQDSGWHGS